MRTLLTIILVLALTGSVLAFDLDSRRPDKPVVNDPVNVPSEMRQGGDTIADAVPISLPYSGTGTTAGYVDDYDEVCPFGGSTSPDVVYTLTPSTSLTVDIDLFGSTYDTKLYVYDESLNLVACNDDFYSDYVSKLENVALVGGTAYFIVIDGYGGAFGDYVILVTTADLPCVLECPPGAELEGEPPLVDEYVDTYNGGCASESGGVMQPLTSPIFCGVSGWYLFQGANYRDTDWFTAVVPPSGSVEVVGDAEQPAYLFELGPQDCNEVDVLQNVTIGDCSEGTLVVTGDPGSTVWLWVGPTTFEGPVNEFDYVLFTNLVPIATEEHSWTGVKALFD